MTDSCAPRRVSVHIAIGSSTLSEAPCNRSAAHQRCGTACRFAGCFSARLCLSTGFRSAVLRRLPDIGYGHTASYAAVAQLAGNPKAVRAVGSACATNPLPVVVPCHRVVRSDGSMGGYLGGTEAKRTLLALESVA